jgi:hypothetical protein
VRNLIRSGRIAKGRNGIFPGTKRWKFFYGTISLQPTDVLAALRQVEVAAAKALPPNKPVGRALKGKLGVTVAP